MSTTDISIDSLAARIGQRIGSSSWITLDQGRIDEFARCTEDSQWIHVDVDRATAESPFGGTIAHGFLTLSLLAPTIFEVLISHLRLKQAVNYGLEKVRFIAPVRAGKRVRNHISVVALEDKGKGRYLLTIENSMEIEGEDKPALRAHSMVMLIARPPEKN
ncbi:MaoC family dehydratase [Variovorax sp. J31P179]|uniref:MaoC family dehydratase n=1 Tax=Variovorax sp. J31P179 TaxID=3053508 RepID=UPI002575BF48|nr:MaoC family dehydratase [Variovorax sp. J31P179]MDM0085441.1 MaoC family dehydratase [Variovorax sp. J31P179]